MLELIAEKSYDKKFGARDIRRIIRSEIEDKIAEVIIDNTDAVITEIKISADDGKLTVDIKK